MVGQRGNVRGLGCSEVWVVGQRGNVRGLGEIRGLGGRSER